MQGTGIKTPSFVQLSMGSMYIIYYNHAVCVTLSKNHVPDRRTIAWEETYYPGLTQQRIVIAITVRKYNRSNHFFSKRILCINIILMELKKMDFTSNYGNDINLNESVVLRDSHTQGINVLRFR